MRIFNSLFTVIITAIFFNCSFAIANVLCPKTMDSWPTLDLCEQSCGVPCLTENTMKCGTYDYRSDPPQDLIYPCDATKYCPSGDYSCDQTGNCQVPDLCTTTSAPGNYYCSLKNSSFAGKDECVQDCAYDYYECSFPQAPGLDGTTYSAYTRDGSNPWVWTYNSDYDPYIECKFACEQDVGCIAKTITEAEYSCMYDGNIYSTLNDCSLNCFEAPQSPKWHCTDGSLTLYDDQVSCEAVCDLAQYQCLEYVFEEYYQCSNHAIEGIWPDKSRCEEFCTHETYNCYSNGQQYANVSDCQTFCNALCKKETDQDTGSYLGYRCMSDNILTAATSNEVADLNNCRSSCDTIGSSGNCVEKIETVPNYTCSSTAVGITTPISNTNKAFCDTQCRDVKCNANSTSYASYSLCDDNCFETTPKNYTCSRKKDIQNNWRCTWTQNDFGGNKEACLNDCNEFIMDGWQCMSDGIGNPAKAGTFYATQAECISSCSYCPVPATYSLATLQNALIHVAPQFSGGQISSYNYNDGGPLGISGYGRNRVLDAQQWTFSNGSFYLTACYGGKSGESSHTGWFFNNDNSPPTYGFNPNNCSIAMTAAYEVAHYNGGAPGGIINHCPVPIGPASLLVPAKCEYGQQWVQHECSNEFYGGYYCSVKDTTFNTNTSLHLYADALVDILIAEYNDKDACEAACSGFEPGDCNFDNSPKCNDSGTVDIYGGWDCVQNGQIVGNWNTGEVNSNNDHSSCSSACESMLSDCTTSQTPQSCEIVDFRSL